MSDTVERYFAAMRRGEDGEQELLDLFADHAVWIDAFGGGEHAGREAIAEWLRSSRADAPPDLDLVVDRVDVDGPTAIAEWTCTSPAFVRPARGRDRFVIRDGRIARLESTMTQPPELG